MKITIYELLGMIKDGKAPKRILYGNYIWSWFGDDYRTILKDGKEQFLITGMYYAWLTEFLNDTVEILEEPKGIPEKIKIDNEDRIQALSTGNFVYKVNQPTKNIIYKINEICDYLKSKGE